MHTDIDIEWYRYTHEKGNKIMSNPYQIRYDVLQMAKELLDRQYETNMQLAYHAMDLAKENNEAALDAWKNYVPEMYTPEEIKKQADKLYSFVTDKKES